MFDILPTYFSYFHKKVSALTFFIFLTSIGVDSTFAFQNNAAQQPAVSKSLLQLHTSVKAEKWLDAKKQAEAILKTGKPAERLQASMIYGRVLLALEQKAEVTAYLKQMQSLKSLDENDQQLLKVYNAWHLAQQGKQDDATKALRTILQRGLPLISTADAADVLAQIYLKKKEIQSAHKTANFGLEHLSYHSLKSPFLETLLKLRLQELKGAPTDSGETIALYNKAEDFRKKKQFVEAGKVYMELQKRFPKSALNEAAGFRIGQCLVGLRNTSEARTHWNQFLKISPSGPWRGQAYLGLVDIALISDLDFTSAYKQIELARSALNGSKESVSEESWKEAGYEINLQAGLLAYAKGDLATASTALQKAQELNLLASNKLQIAQLIKEAGTQKMILPIELVSQESSQSNSDKLTPQQRLEGLFKLARLNNRLKRYAEAAQLLDSMGKQSTSLKQPIQKSYLLSQLARAQHGQQQYADALLNYRSAINQHRMASWHDETLYYMAILIERIGELDPKKLVEKKQSGSVVKPSLDNLLKNPLAPKPSPNTIKRRLSRAERLALEKAERVNNARQLALVNWQQILKSFPESIYREPALYHTALITHQMLSGPQLKGQKNTHSFRWENVVEMFQKFVNTYPRSGWIGDVYVKLVDIQLERLFDLTTSEQHSQAGMAWLKDRLEIPSQELENISDFSSRFDDPLALSANTADTANHRAQTRWKQVAYDINVRAGLIAYLKQDYSKAANLFEKAKPFQPPRAAVVVHGKVPTGIEKLIITAKSGRSLTPEPVLEGNEKARLILMLADIYYEGQQYERSIELCDRILKSSAYKATKAQKSYAFFKRARNRYLNLSTNPEERKMDISSVSKDYRDSQKTDSRAIWADNCLFYLANMAWNHAQDANSAVATYKRLLKQYPESEEADRSAYFIGVTYEWSKRYREAKDAFEYSQKYFPDSRFAQLVQKHMKEVDAALQDEKKPGASKNP